MPSLKCRHAEGPVLVADATVVPQRGHGRHVAVRRRGRVPRPAPRPGRVRHRGQDDGHPDPVSVGKPIERNKYGIDGAVVTLTPGPVACAPTSMACRSTACSPPTPAGMVTDTLGQRTDRRPRLRRHARDCWRRSRSRTADAAGHARGPHAHRRDDRERDDRPRQCRCASASTRTCSCPACRARSGCSRRRPCASARWTTGASRPARTRSGPRRRRPLADTLYDDGFDEVAPKARCSPCRAAAGASRCTSTRVIPPRRSSRPGNDDVIGIEPMAAPTDALRRGGYRLASAGEPAVAQFRIKVG